VTGVRIGFADIAECFGEARGGEDDQARFVLRESRRGDDKGDNPPTIAAIYTPG